MQLNLLENNTYLVCIFILTIILGISIAITINYLKKKPVINIPKNNISVVIPNETLDYIKKPEKTIIKSNIKEIENFFDYKDSIYNKKNINSHLSESVLLKQSKKYSKKIKKDKRLSKYSKYYNKSKKLKKNHKYSAYNQEHIDQYYLNI